MELWNFGQTGQNIITKRNNHNSNFTPTRNRYNKTSSGLDNLKHEISYDNCPVLAFLNHWQKRFIKESLYQVFSKGPWGLPKRSMGSYRVP